jgi:hypothetical protein
MKTITYFSLLAGLAGGIASPADGIAVWNQTMLAAWPAGHASRIRRGGRASARARL